MLTVKHMEVTGAEVVYSAEKAGFQPRTGPDGKPADPREGGTGYSAAYVFIEDAKGERTPIGHWGTFYVVNEAGKTVAKYELGGWITGPGTQTDRPETGNVYPPISTSGGTGTSGPLVGMSLRHGSDGSVTATRVG